MKILVLNMNANSMSVANEDDAVLGKLDRSPGQEELYDKVRKEVIERGLRLEVAGTTVYTGCYYTIYKGLCGDGGHKLEINPDRMQPMAIW